jgi:hypothetical protein
VQIAYAISAYPEHSSAVRDDGMITSLATPPRHADSTRPAAAENGLSVKFRDDVCADHCSVGSFPNVAASTAPGAAASSSGSIEGDVGVTATDGEDDLVDEAAVSSICEILNCTEAAAQEALRAAYGSNANSRGLIFRLLIYIVCADVEGAIERFLNSC